MKITSPAANLFLSLYDVEMRIVWMSAVAPGIDPASVIGKHPWEFLTYPHDSFLQAAMLRCLVNAEPQTLESIGPTGRVWRVLLYRLPLTSPRILGVSRLFPQSTLSLTPREREVCTLLADGLGSKQIAARLKIARPTVDNLRASASRRLGIMSSSLVAWSAEHREWLS